MGHRAKNTLAPLSPSKSLQCVLGSKRISNQIGPVKLFIPAADALALAIAAIGGTLLQGWYSANQGITPPLWSTQAGSLTILIYVCLTIGAIARFWLLGHYTRRRPFADETREMLLTLFVLAVADAAMMYLVKLSFSRFWFLATWAFAFVLVPFARISSKALLDKIGKWKIPTIIIGTGPNAREAAAALHSERLMGLHVVAFAALRQNDLPKTGHIELGHAAIPVVLVTDPVAEISTIGQPNIVVALERGELSESHRTIERLHRHFSELSIVPTLRGLPLYGMEVNHFFRHEVLFLRLRNNLARRGPRLFKRSFDILGSAILLVAFSPLFAYIAARIRKSGGSVFFSHPRVGYKGKAFNCHKFRTMVPNAQQVLNDLLGSDPTALAEWQRDFKLKNDPRVTAIGTFLRRTSLDELPQLWNVLRGEMSLVGPRPVIEVELSRYGEDVEFYLEARPGMTGLWQISGRNDTDYSNRVYLDTWYVKNWSLWQDIVILLATIRVVLHKSGAY